MAENEALLSEEQVNSVMQYAAGLYASERFGFGAYSPWMSNSLLVGLNNDSKIPTSKKIKDALGNAAENAEVLQSYTSFMRHFDAIFERTLYSYVNALSMDITIHCNNAYTKAEYQSEEYKADKRRFYEFLEKFDYKKEFHNVLMNVMTHETYYTWFRKTKWGNKGMKLALQTMPQNYCMLTGYWEKGMLFDL